MLIYRNYGGEVMFDVNYIANYFLTLSEPDVGDGLSNLKLQKLLYYAQGMTLAIMNEELFEDEIYAWNHGPVVEKMYHKFKEYGRDYIKIPENISFKELRANTKIIEILNNVFDRFGQYSAWMLRNKTHAEKPWKDTELSEIISKDLIKNFFKEEMINEQG